MTARLAIAVVAVGLGAPSWAAGEPTDWVVYRCKQNETLAMIASEFYGDRGKAVFIAAANKMLTAPRPLVRGQALRIPTNREYVTAPGDTLQAIAVTQLGDAERADLLADFNKLSPDDSLPAGTTIVVPFRVTYTATTAESFEAIATAVYGDRKLTDQLRHFNKTDKTTLDKNESIVLPGYNVKMHPTRVLMASDGESKQRRERQQTVARAAAQALPAARYQWRIGDFAAVRKLLEPIETAYLELAPAIEVGLLLGSSLAALSSPDDAVTAFKRVLDRKPTYALRRADYPRKVLELWAQAGGQTE